MIGSMEKVGRWISAALLLVVLGIAPLGCEQEGPAEKAGEKIDQAVEEAGDKVEEATD